MNEALSDTDNPSHLHLELESNIFSFRKLTSRLLLANCAGHRGTFAAGSAGALLEVPDLPQVTPSRQRMTKSRRHDSPVPRVTI